MKADSIYVILFQFFFLVHPCEKATIGGCSQKCNIEGYSLSCSCLAGFKLAVDGKFCEKSEFFSVLENSSREDDQENKLIYLQ